MVVFEMLWEKWDTEDSFVLKMKLLNVLYFLINNPINQFQPNRAAKLVIPLIPNPVMCNSTYNTLR